MLLYTLEVEVAVSLQPPACVPHLNCTWALLKLIHFLLKLMTLLTALFTSLCLTFFTRPISTTVQKYEVHCFHWLPSLLLLYYVQFSTSDPSLVAGPFILLITFLSNIFKVSSLSVSVRFLIYRLSLVSQMTYVVFNLFCSHFLIIKCILELLLFSYGIDLFLVGNGLG